MRIVVDTNVIIDALFEDDGWCESVLELDDIEVLANPDTLQELKAVFQLLIDEYRNSGQADPRRMARMKAGLDAILGILTIIPHTTRTNFCKQISPTTSS